MPSDRFLEEVRIQFENELRLKETLDDKASKIIAAAGAVATLLFGFGSFLFISNNNTNGPEFFSQLGIAILLMIGAAASIVAILFALLAYRLHKYRYAMGHEQFYNEKTGTIEESVLNHFKKASTDNFDDRMIREYLQSVKENAEMNAKKVQWITIAHWWFFGSVTSPIIMIISFFMQ